jgi:hypothetical protein
LGVSLAVQVLTVLVPGLRNLLGTTLPTLTDGLVMGAGALTPLLINEVTKRGGGLQSRRRLARPRETTPH